MHGRADDRHALPAGDLQVNQHRAAKILTAVLCAAAVALGISEFWRSCGVYFTDRGMDYVMTMRCAK